jgi:uncharacterized membrane protein
MRAFAKTATYAVMHFAVAFTVAYLLTGSWAAAAAIGLVEPFVQTFAYSLHERAWAKVPRHATLAPQSA